MRRSFIPAAFAVTCALLAATVLHGTPVQAHGGATGVVKERMDLMKSLGDEVKTLARMFKGDVPYDPADVAAAAARIEDGSGGHMLRLFPEGSGGHPSEARDDVWQHWPEFEAKADDLGTRASVLAAVTDAGKGEAKAAFGALVGTCKACHREFKAE